MKTENVKNLYNEQVKDGYDYEYNRWHKNQIREAGYQMTLSAIHKYALASGFADCFELGPGHGTWTHELLVKNPEASFDLLDISREMLNLSRQRFAEKENFHFIEADFLEYVPEKQYDLFFSSRAFEYIPDKDKVVSKIASLIKPGGRGFIITKTPKYLRAKLLGRKIEEFHSGQIEPKALAKLLESNNCTNIKIYPVTMSFPLFGSAGLNLLLYRLFGSLEMNFVSKFFSESYCVKFDKI